MSATTTTVTASNRTAIVPRNNDDDNEITTSSSSSAVVLDALPYVETLDPNYEQYAISLIEEELQHVVVEQQQRAGSGVGDDRNVDIGEHPSLWRILPVSTNLAAVGGNEIATRTPDFGGRAPLAAAAYEALAARRRRAAEGESDDVGAIKSTLPFSINRPDPMAEDGAEDETDEGMLVSKLRLSIATSKIRLEQERLRLVNLELHQSLETPARYTAYASVLDSQYLDPTSQAVERQRRTVDGINATRMEEQTQAIRNLEGMAGKWESLVDKNQKLWKALVGLEREVESLKEDVKMG
eukprot:CAMPEP_0172530984 /NCGR_PEP_ID=MMETSP1067-20121228/4561_1 /TAXON_ID=265564 ORGANISM="Thalassiosira punctigera, Strain Tpunct2005C2" /NCGR_SAMPLE_ID=MMETSP1067 /ASSEMBLY_ACC=CAM_ASM_000444 /LENGTH=296 /DNA_ID=CAMNT_0013315303 /DNA_START=68 /DNA_END=955 /DNA_ORIENTATION=-